MGKLYAIYNPETFEIEGQVFSYEKPEHGVLATENNFIKPKYNPESGIIYESASVEFLTEKANEEIEDLRNKTRISISALLYEHTQRKIMRDIPIPNEIDEQYNEMRNEYKNKKQEIYSRYGI